MTDVARSRLALLMALLSVLALVTLVANTRPGPAEQMLFFGLLFVAGTGVAAVAARLVLKRYARPEWLARDSWRAEREGLLFGLWLVAVAWLRMQRTLDLPGLVLLAGAVALVEVVIIMRRAP